MQIQPDTMYQQYCQALHWELRDVFASREGFLYKLLRYQLNWTDQQGQPEENPSVPHLQSMLPMVICQAVSGGFETALPVAAAVELVHQFTLVHSDVQAGRVDADARPGIWWVWGPAQAINAGDGFHALGRATMMRMTKRGIPLVDVLKSVQSLDLACLALCEGQYMDLTFQDQLMVTSAAYLDMIGRKTGALCGCAAKLGAVASGADSRASTKFEEVGVKLGIALQITQDIGELWGKADDGVTPGNLLNKKKSLPIIHALENSTTAAKREITGLYMKRVMDPSDVSRILSILDASDARQHAQDKAREFTLEATEIAEDAGVSHQNMGPIERLAQWALGTTPASQFISLSSQGDS